MSVIPLSWMLRTKLLLAFLGLLAPAVVMGSLLYWGPRQIEQRLDRSLLAHNEVQLYLTLALQTYRDLQRLSQEVLLGQPVREAEVLASRRRLDEHLTSLRQLTLEELAFVGMNEPEEREELARIERFAQLADSWATALTKDVSTDLTSFRRRLDLFDQELGTLIDEVITDETGEADVADRQTRALTRRLTLARDRRPAAGHRLRGPDCAVGPPAHPGADRGAAAGDSTARGRRARPPRARVRARRARGPGHELQLDGGGAAEAAGRAGPITDRARTRGARAHARAARQQRGAQPHGRRPPPHVRGHQPCAAHAADGDPRRGRSHVACPRHAAAARPTPPCSASSRPRPRSTSSSKTC